MFSSVFCLSIFTYVFYNFSMLSHCFITTKVLTIYSTSEVIAEPLFWQRFCYPSSVAVHWREKIILLPEPHTALFFFLSFTPHFNSLPFLSHLFPWTECTNTCLQWQLQLSGSMEEGWNAKDLGFNSDWQIEKGILCEIVEIECYKEALFSFYRTYLL